MTQIVGSVVQLLQLSPALTGTMLASVPVFYGFGNLYGIYLRQLSREAKRKDGLAAGVAGEVISSRAGGDGLFYGLTPGSLTHSLECHSSFAMSINTPLVPPHLNPQSFSNIRTVRAFANEPLEYRQYDRALEEASAANEKLGYHIGIFQGITNFSIGGMVLGVLYFGGNMVARQEMSAGDLMSYLLSVQATQKSLGTSCRRASWMVVLTSLPSHRNPLPSLPTHLTPPIPPPVPAAQVGVLFAQAVKAFSSYGRVSEYLRSRPTIPLRGGKTLGSSLRGQIEFDRVRFAYPSRPDQLVLDQFHLQIDQGQVVALCGSSGAGKSTIGAVCWARGGLLASLPPPSRLPLYS